MILIMVLGRLQIILKVLFVEMHANVVFVISCLYSTVSLTLVREKCFIRINCYYYNINVVFGISCSYSVVSLTLVRE